MTPTLTASATAAITVEQARPIAMPFADAGDGVTLYYEEGGSG